MSDLKGRTFYKIEGGGNDFITFLDFDKNLDLDFLPDLARRVCPRGSGIGADGIIHASSAENTDIRMIYFNADGSHAALCGNGLRALALLVYRIGIESKEFKIQTDAGTFDVIINTDHLVKNSFAPPRMYNNALELKFADTVYTGVHLDVGIPYYCVFLSSSEDLESLDIVSVGRGLRNHSEFGAQGSNITFIFRESENRIHIRIFERGIEGETLSSGTGALSSAVSAAMKFKQKAPTEVFSPGGNVKIFFKQSGESFENLWLEGNASILYKGEIIDS